MYFRPQGQEWFAQARRRGALERQFCDLNKPTVVSASIVTVKRGQM